jgi:hypothetical protein
MKSVSNMHNIARSAALNASHSREVIESIISNNLCLVLAILVKLSSIDNSIYACSTFGQHVYVRHFPSDHFVWRLSVWV